MPSGPEETGRPDAPGKTAAPNWVRLGINRRKRERGPSLSTETGNRYSPARGAIDVPYPKRSVCRVVGLVTDQSGGNSYTQSSSFSLSEPAHSSVRELDSGRRCRSAHSAVSATMGSS